MDDKNHELPIIAIFHSYFKQPDGFSTRYASDKEMIGLTSGHEKFRRPWIHPSMPSLSDRRDVLDQRDECTKSTNTRKAWCFALGLIRQGNQHRSGKSMKIRP